ncbi:DUF72 domain-containing protein [Deminuibacter soli]|uniref:DUF72 domain-containing protein n=1 Tax=Deminuibacter soli TaxID=2291815 RepID=A0A3E1NQU8_9BACT|nr:DUF72 domain-containing protein [Deminuibacter soli]RFM30305.1 DUF72 domain-containing protein [Deminuibacter soli]
MDFGKLTPAELEEVNFALPAESAWNKKILPAGKPVAHPQVYIGCAKWGRKEWLGKIYPKGTKDAQFLDHYVDHYNSIELNATHYQVYGTDTISKWAAKAKGMDFKFCPKIPQSISHYSSFVNVDATTDKFLEGVLAFKDHLGPIFLQVSDKYAPTRKDNLFNYLLSLPKDLQFFLEVRHPDWFSDKGAFKTLLETLHAGNIGLIITDTAGRRDCAHMHLTIPKAFIRYVGNSLHPTDYTRIDEWVKRIQYWLKHGLEELYFFMHMHDEALSPELTVYLVDALEKKCGLQLKRPKFIQPGLF